MTAFQARARRPCAWTKARPKCFSCTSLSPQKRPSSTKSRGIRITLAPPKQMFAPMRCPRLLTRVGLHDRVVHGQAGPVGMPRRHLLLQDLEGLSPLGQWGRLNLLDIFGHLDTCAAPRLPALGGIAI